MKHIRDWQDYPNSDYVVELEPDDIVISAHYLEEIEKHLSYLKDRVKYHDDQFEPLKLIEEFQTDLQLLRLSGNISGEIQ